MHPGKKFFFEPRFSGALLDESNQGPIGGALGLVGDTGKVSCSGCHIPKGSYSDIRTPRRQNSLGAGWTRRRAPSLLDVGQQTFLMWDGARDTAYSQVFTPMEDGTYRLVATSYMQLGTGVYTLTVRRFLKKSQ